MAERNEEDILGYEIIDGELIPFWETPPHLEAAFDKMYAVKEMTFIKSPAPQKKP